MGKAKLQARNKQGSSSKLPTKSNNTSTPPATLSTATAIADDPILGYRFRVLIYDFLHVTKDPQSERRVNSTTDEHYISAPYFDDDQAAIIKAVTIDVDLGKEITDGNATHYMEVMEAEERSDVPASPNLKGQTFDNALRTLLKSFIDKRRASGDARPCGPHHLAPMYASLLGIKLCEVQDDKFLSRLRRCGI